MADSKARIDKSRVDEDGHDRTTKRILSVTKNTEGDFSTIDNYSKGNVTQFSIVGEEPVHSRNYAGPGSITQVKGTITDKMLQLILTNSPGRLCYNPGNEGLSLQSKTTIGRLVRVTGDNVIDIKESVTSMWSLEANHTSQERSRGTDGYRRRHPEFPVQTDNPKNDNKSSPSRIF
ncbi:hypothetical protein CC80DRAFT_542576 [Byssothecium circinans]|uniref:Uncharacterized protein n=1 Tax=Byssothecium circinans TaxID=147558 RepID=A0A6A5UBY0_9PLEO|nr:hypothetical protein CC80DRAFT_542576 [Byssothecium circinans]